MFQRQLPESSNVIDRRSDTDGLSVSDSLLYPVDMAAALPSFVNSNYIQPWLHGSYGPYDADIDASIAADMNQPTDQTAMAGTMPMGPANSRWAKGGSVSPFASPQIPKLTGFPGEGAAPMGTPFSGPINTPVPGRTDRHHMRVKNGSYVIPADVVSGVGQGNTQAGHAAFNALFPKTKMPHGHLPSSHAPREARMAMRHSGIKGLHMPMAHGGEADAEEDPEVVTAGGEHVLTPEQITARYHDAFHALRPGDKEYGKYEDPLDMGHNRLDQMVKRRRAKTIKEMQKLPGPKK